MSLKSAHAAIAAANASPELSFAAMMVASAVEAAKEGDHDAYQWLELCSLRWLVAVTPVGVDYDRVRTALLETVPEPAAFRGAANFQPSEALPSSVQLELPELTYEGKGNVNQ